MSSSQELDPASLNWRTRWALRRNRILGSVRFQQWAAKTPVFRAVARRKAAAQFDLIAGFVYTQITQAFVTTGLLQHLREGPRQKNALAAFLNLSQDASERLLKAGAALDLAESPQQDVWTLGEAGAALSANEGALAMIGHHALLYRDLADPVGMLSIEGRAKSELSRFWTYAGAEQSAADEAAPYSELMRATQPMVWQQIIGRYPFARHRKMLDIGGGSGAFAEAVRGVAPRLELGIFDLPEVAALARKRLAAGSSGQPITVHAGSFRDDDLPTGYDLITLIRILHDHDDDVAQLLLNKVHAALPPGGRLLIVEPMAQTPGAAGMGDAYFGIYLWVMGQGRPRSSDENSLMLRNAGFSAVSEISTGLPIIAKALLATK